MSTMPPKWCVVLVPAACLLVGFLLPGGVDSVGDAAAAVVGGGSPSNLTRS